MNDLLAVLGDYGKTSGIDSTDSNGDVRILSSEPPASPCLTYNCRCRRA